jgi:hypothetical protein
MTGIIHFDKIIVVLHRVMYCLIHFLLFIIDMSISDRVETKTKLNSVA